MKKITILLLFFITTFTFAQVALSKDYDYKVSDPYKTIDLKGKQYFSNGHNILSVKYDTNKPKRAKIVIQSYDIESMKEIKKKIYSDFFPMHHLFEKIIQVNNKLFLFYSSRANRKAKDERLFYREIDFSSGELIGKTKLLLSYEGHLDNFYNNGWEKFDIKVSDDESKILIKYKKKPTVRNDRKYLDIIMLNVFDSTLKNIWNETYTMPYVANKMRFLGNKIDNDGNVFLIIKKFHDKRNVNNNILKKQLPNYHFELFQFNKKSENIKISKFTLENKYINGIKIFQSKNNDVYCAGTFNQGADFNFSYGLFLYKIDKEKGIVEKKHYMIPLEILNQYAKKKVIKKNKKKSEKGKAAYKELILKDVTFYDDNSVGLIGEVDYVLEHYQGGGINGAVVAGGSTTYSYHYEDILFTKIYANGKLAWMKKIPKRQKGSIGKGGMSYTYFNTNGNHYFIYLDNVKNIKLPFDKIPALHTDGKGGYLTAVKIDDKTGEMNKEYILDTRNLKGKIRAYQFNTDRIVKIEDNAFFVEVYKKKKEDIFLKVEIK